MDQQQLCGEEDGYSRHGRFVVFAGDLFITLAGHAGCGSLPPGDMRPFLAVGLSVTTVPFLWPQPRWLGFDLDGLVGQSKDSLDFAGIKDQTFPLPSKGWRVLTGDFQ